MSMIQVRDTSRQSSKCLWRLKYMFFSLGPSDTNAREVRDSCSKSELSCLGRGNNTYTYRFGRSCHPYD